MKTKHIMAAAGLAAAILGGFFFMKGKEDAPVAVPVRSPAAMQAPPAATQAPPAAAATQVAGAGAVPGTVPPPPAADSGEAGGDGLSEEERKRLIEFEKSIDMIDTPSGKRPRRPF